VVPNRIRVLLSGEQSVGIGQHGVEVVAFACRNLPIPFRQQAQQLALPLRSLVGRRSLSVEAPIWTTLRGLRPSETSPAMIARKSGS
jgi:hypothetical protein